MTDPRQTAYLWHSGQWSPLYAFASSGIVEDRAALIAEIRECIAGIEAAPEVYAVDDRARLLGLIDFVEDLPSDGITTTPLRCYAPWARR